MSNVSKKDFWSPPFHHAQGTPPAWTQKQGRFLELFFFFCFGFFFFSDLNQIQNYEGYY